VACSGSRPLAPGLFQGGTDYGSGRIVQSPATIEAVTARMQLAFGMFLAMPAAASQQDRKSIIQKINTDRKSIPTGGSGR
jgi:hypothetical protein